MFVRSEEIILNEYNSTIIRILMVIFVTICLVYFRKITKEASQKLRKDIYGLTAIIIIFW